MQTEKAEAKMIDMVRLTISLGDGSVEDIHILVPLEPVPEQQD